MPSPFPGMDPYLEPHWPDVHHRLVTYAADQLNERLPGRLVATTDERVAVESDDEFVRRIGPDVKVFAPSSTDPDEHDAPIAIQAPFKFVVDADPIKEYFVRIVDEHGQLVTVIEFLSPTNKTGRGLTEYRRKRGELLRGGIHVVEVDLVRAGDWRALMAPGRCPPEAVAPYRVTIRTSARDGAGYLFPIRLDQPLPPIPIPLRRSDPLVHLDLQTMMIALYDRGRYEVRVNYSSRLDPPLDPPDVLVAERLLRRQGTV